MLSKSHLLMDHKLQITEKENFNVLNLLDSRPVNKSNSSRPSCPIYLILPHNVLILFPNKCFPSDKQPFFNPFVFFFFWSVYIPGGRVGWK